jgi:hypothetical protein
MSPKTGGSSEIWTDKLSKRLFLVKASTRYNLKTFSEKCILLSYTCSKLWKSHLLQATQIRVNSRRPAGAISHSVLYTVGQHANNAQDIHAHCPDFHLEKNFTGHLQQKNDHPIVKFEVT